MKGIIVKISHVVVLVIALIAGLVIGAKKPGLVSSLSGGMISA